MVPLKPLPLTSSVPAASSADGCRHCPGCKRAGTAAAERYRPARDGAKAREGGRQ